MLLFDVTLGAMTRKDSSLDKIQPILWTKLLALVQEILHGMGSRPAFHKEDPAEPRLATSLPQDLDELLHFVRDLGQVQVEARFGHRRGNLLRALDQIQSLSATVAVSQLNVLFEGVKNVPPALGSKPRS